LCGLPCGSEVKSLILNRVVLLSIEGSGELLFVGRHENELDTKREIIAVRVRNIDQANFLVQSWRSEIALPSGSELTVLREAPMRPTDNPMMAFP
jgi:hypothetical protein